MERMSKNAFGRVDSSLDMVDIEYFIFIRSISDHFVGDILPRRINIICKMLLFSIFIPKALSPEFTGSTIYFP